MNYTRQISILITCLFFMACKKEVTPPSDVELGREYFPITQGHFIEYEVDSIVYNDFTKTVDTTHSEFRDEIGEEFLDNENRKSYLVKRSVRKFTSNPWQERLVYYFTPTQSSIEVVDDNLRFIKLVFPIKENTRWYGNAYLSTQFNPDLQWLNNKNWYYKYQDLSIPYFNSILNFDSTASILQVNEYTGDSTNADAYSDRTYAKEVYAKGIGLVYRNITYWVYQSNIKFRKGFSVTLRAKNFN
jgi:hypothetical protein